MVWGAFETCLGLCWGLLARLGLGFLGGLESDRSVGRSVGWIGTRPASASVSWKRAGWDGEFSLFSFLFFSFFFLLKPAPSSSSPSSSSSLSTRGVARFIFAGVFFPEVNVCMRVCVCVRVFMYPGINSGAFFCVVCVRACVFCYY